LRMCDDPWESIGGLGEVRDFTPRQESSKTDFTKPMLQFTFTEEELLGTYKKEK
jgi:hypothetical protein